MNSMELFRKAYFLKDEKGTVLVMSLLIILVLTILSLTGMMNSMVELKMSANDRSAKKVFYVAEAGSEDARSRLTNIDSASTIPDNQPTNADWKAFIGTAPDAALEGYIAANSNHALYPRLVSSPDLNYVVTVSHKKNSSGQILKWGFANGILGENTSAGNNVFVITSKGRESTGASKSVQIDATNISLYAPAALYTKEITTLQGHSTYDQGRDQCGPGDGSSDVYGVLSMRNVTSIGLPVIDGSPRAVEQNSPINIDVAGLVNQFKTELLHF